VHLLQATYKVVMFWRRRIYKKMELQDRELYHLIQSGVQRCEERKQPVLISHVACAGMIDPLAFFGRAEKRKEKEIVYWADANEDFILVGVGSVYSIKVEDNGSDRFSRIEDEWSRIVETSIRSSSCENPQTGLVLLGGGAFDPIKPQSERWRHFANAEFHLPRMLLTRKDGKSWITINYFLQGSENPKELTETLLKECEWLLSGEKYQLSAVGNSFAIEEVDAARWVAMVERIVQCIREGEMEKVVLARELHLHSETVISITDVLSRLHTGQPGSYIFAFAHHGDCLIGASPERLIKRKGDEYYSTCLAGSIKRGRNQMEDEMLGRELLNDKKNRFEQNLVVRMLGDKLKKYCESLEIPAEPHLKTLRNIYHLCTPLKGKALPGTSIFTVLADLHPSPALGGFPQKEAIKKIRDEEQLDRGWYGGPIGWVDANGAGEFIVAIRCGLVRENEVFLFAGCGIVENSDPVSEYEETKIKFQPMLSALGGN